METDRLVAGDQSRCVEEADALLETAPPLEVVEIGEGAVIVREGQCLSDADLAGAPANEVDEHVHDGARHPRELPGAVARLVKLCVTRHPTPRFRSGPGDLGEAPLHHRPELPVS